MSASCASVARFSSRGLLIGGISGFLATEVMPSTQKTRAVNASATLTASIDTGIVAQATPQARGMPNVKVIVTIA